MCFTTDDLKSPFAAWADRIAFERDSLSALDGAVGVSSGPLYATAFLRAAKAAGPVPAMPGVQLREVIVAMRDGNVHRGKAAPGQKTMINT